MRSHLGMHTVMWPFTSPKLSRVAFFPGWGALNLLSKSVSATVDCHFSQSYCPLYLPIYITRRFRVFHRGLLYKESRDMVGLLPWVKVFRVFSKEGRYSLTTTADCCLIDYPFTNNAPDTMWMDLGGSPLHARQVLVRLCSKIWRFRTVSSR
jgi:hypothetical protein